MEVSAPPRAAPGPMPGRDFGSEVWCPPRRGHSGTSVTARPNQIQPLTADNLSRWTEAQEEFSEERRLAFIMRYVRDQSGLLSAMPRPPEPAPEAKAKHLPPVPEVLSSTEKPARKNLVAEMKRKDGSTPPSNPTPLRDRRNRRNESPLVSSAKPAHNMKDQDKPKETSARKPARKSGHHQAHSVHSSTSEGDARKHTRRRRSQSRKPARDSASEAESAHKRLYNASESDDVEDDPERTRKRKKSAAREEKRKPGPAKAAGRKKSDKTKDDRFQSQLVASGARLTIRKPNQEEEADGGAFFLRDPVISIANKLGIFNKGKASTKALASAPSLAFNESRFLGAATAPPQLPRLDAGKRSEGAQSRTAEASEKKGAETIGAISHFFASAVEKTKGRNAEPEAGEAVDDGIEPGSLPSPPRNERAAAPKKDAEDDSQPSPTHSSQKSEPRPSRKEAGAMQVDTTDLHARMSQSREQGGHNSKKQAGQDAAQPRTIPQRDHDAQAANHAARKDKESLPIRSRTVPIDMEAVDDLLETIEQAMIPVSKTLDTGRDLGQDEDPADAPDDEPHYLLGGEYLDQSCYHDASGHPAEEDWRRDPEFTAALDRDGWMRHNTPAGTVADHAYEHPAEEPHWDVMLEGDDYATTGAAFDQHLRGSWEQQDELAIDPEFISALPWKAAQQTHGRPFVGHGSHTSGSGRASWRSFAALSTDSLPRSPRRRTSSAPFTRPNPLY
ncbi:hypothetical protein DFJ74DRAFT_657814 [Hyaloraphidium curvatum]|nr:hypothetical protein DFJ74DRAFT_657814 [Hyaloraphidium curvatum]